MTFIKRSQFQAMMMDEFLYYSLGKYKILLIRFILISKLQWRSRDFRKRVSWPGVELGRSLKQKKKHLKTANNLLINYGYKFEFFLNFICNLKFKFLFSSEDNKQYNKTPKCFNEISPILISNGFKENVNFRTQSWYRRNRWNLAKYEEQL